VHQGIAQGRWEHPPAAGAQVEGEGGILEGEVAANLGVSAGVGVREAGEVAEAGVTVDGRRLGEGSVEGVSTGTGEAVDAEGLVAVEEEGAVAAVTAGAAVAIGAESFISMMKLELGTPPIFLLSV
jgi:hypothetical protein